LKGDTGKAPAWKIERRKKKREVAIMDVLAEKRMEGSSSFDSKSFLMP
jgi:hypothetical protein